MKCKILNRRGGGRLGSVGMLREKEVIWVRGGEQHGLALGRVKEEVRLGHHGKEGEEKWAGGTCMFRIMRRSI